MEVNDQKTICLGISRINNSSILQKLATLNIFISNSSANNKLCLFEKHSDEIHILLGSGIVGKLFIGEVKQLSEGLTAVNTRLGWTVMGKLSNESKFKSENSLLVHSLLTNREKISDLWKLDSLGIKDPSEKRSKLELQDLALKHFENTILRDDEGRYIVSINWIEGSGKLEDHYSLAKGRLEKTVKTLKFTGRLFDYEQVFVDWEKEGIIEKIAQNEPNKYDVEDLEPLTPAMFLQDIREVGVPELDRIDENKLNKRLVYRNRIQTDLRKRFRVEYLGQLRKIKNIKGEDTLSEGDIVLVGDDHTKRINWNLGKILKLYPGKDEKVKVAQVKTKLGTFLRPVQKLYLLEVMEKTKSSVHPTNSPLFSDANEESHLPINIDPELSKHQAAATPLTQYCSSVSNGGARLEPRAETSSHQ
ncbi:integrase catalytic domain-containing protein [Trichonephila clavata]|uniref:Integrase catalytic domain-containing protein n=1 Tax=Trichonephila clavata TaxID=2740835 RepID=A0A8X6HDE2_TRICU|nr:integrase catalytic domain-containing protein [Trichonephila clavata]